MSSNALLVSVLVGSIEATSLMGSFSYLTARQLFFPRNLIVRSDFHVTVVDPRMASEFDVFARWENKDECETVSDSVMGFDLFFHKNHTIFGVCWSDRSRAECYRKRVAFCELREWHECTFPSKHVDAFLVDSDDVSAWMDGMTERDVRRPKIRKKIDAFDHKIEQIDDDE